ncbi:beta-1,4-galactosyltransferase 7 [Arctopsyche grandis]|uniref:beta-1,4-galactosyltransferase 7 n=1 Tax=Arctopsyche grandis TaxID=121162 RepID=UPI00406DA122
MRRRGCSPLLAISGLALVSLLLTCFAACYLVPPDTCSCNVDEKRDFDTIENTYLPTNSHRLAVLVPFRDRFDELMIFAPYMNKYLRQQRINFDIYIVNQVDSFRFNRASLINVGFLQTRHNHDYIAMHDVDLLPLNPNLHYGYPKHGPFHVASPNLHPRYHYPTFVGGILLVNRDHFELVDGMSNKYWGWGLEDDEFYVRLKEAKLEVSRPINISTDQTNTFRHIHDRLHRKRDTAKCFNQREATKRRDRDTGLHNVEYTLASEQKLVIDGVSVTILNVQLSCDKSFTPWCECTQNTESKNVKKPIKGKS